MTGRPAVLQSMESQIVGHDWAKLNQTEGIDIISRSSWILTKKTGDAKNYIMSGKYKWSKLSIYHIYTLCDVAKFSQWRNWASYTDNEIKQD